MCLGHKYGTTCKRVVRTHRHVFSWENFQLCSKCAKNPLTESYRITKNIIVH